MPLMLGRFFSCFFPMYQDLSLKPYWFSCKERVFRREDEIKDFENRDEREWVQVPVISECEIYMRYLEIYGRSDVIEKFKDLNQKEFRIKLLDYAYEEGFEDEMKAFKISYESNLVYDWMKDNHIMNAKIFTTPPPRAYLDLPLKERSKKVIAHFKQQKILQDQDEENYKKRMNQ